MPTNQIYEEAKLIVHDDGSALLDLPEVELNDLPSISVVTILNDTPNPEKYIGSLLHCWSQMSSVIPKIEWVILDTCNQNLEQYFPIEDNIKYYRQLEEIVLTQHEKQNLVNSLTGNDYISHLDYTNYYFPDSLLAKIRVLEKYNRQCVFSWEIGVFNILDRESYIVRKIRQTADIDFSSLMYSKKYWEKHKFTENKFDFIKKRFDKCITINFLFNTIHLVTINENVENVENGNSSSNTTLTNANFRDVLSESYLDILENMRDLILRCEAS